jgi:hypothetical protein
MALLWRGVAWRQVRVGFASALVFVLTGIALSDEYSSAFIELGKVKVFAHCFLQAGHASQHA